MIVVVFFPVEDYVISILTENKTKDGSKKTDVVKVILVKLCKRAYLHSRDVRSWKMCLHSK